MSSSIAGDGGGNGSTLAGIDLKALAVPAVGAVLVARGLQRDSVGGAVMTVAGGGLIYRGITSSSAVAEVLGRPTAATDAHEAGAPADAPEIQRTLTIGRPADELYRLWRDPDTVPKVMHGVVEVVPEGTDRFNWTFHGPLGATFAWQTRVIEDRPGELIRWESVEGAQVANEGAVEFRPAPQDWGTEVTLRIRVDPPGGAIGDAALKIARSAPNLMVGKVVRRFKNLAETGEIPTTEPQPAARPEKS